MPEVADARMMRDKANAFLHLLHKPQKDRSPGNEYALFDYDGPHREVMHYLVPSARLRRGLPLRAMNGPQMEAALALLRASLSDGGFAKVEAIRSLEHVLIAKDDAEVAADSSRAARRFVRDPAGYYVSVFTPAAGGDQIAATALWGWRFEGHHVSLHWTLAGEQVLASTPQFLGAQPAWVTEHIPGGPPANTRVLGGEATLARQLVDTLSSSQRRVGVAYVPWDIETGVARDALNERHPPLLEQRGLRYADMDATQRELLELLVHLYAHTQRPAVASQRLDTITRVGWNDTRFLWMGAPDAGGAQYYRIVLPTVFVIEYDNVAFGQPEHEHTVWRDLSDDWGRRSAAAHADANSIERHYATSDHHAVDRLRAQLHRDARDGSAAEARLREMISQEDGWHAHAGVLHRHGHGHGHDFAARDGRR